MLYINWQFKLRNTSELLQKQIDDYKTRTVQDAMNGSVT